MKPQQDQAFKQFNEGVDDWLNRESGTMNKVNVIRQRNGAVLHVAKSLANISDALDLGCGTGNLVIDLALGGIRATGIDFAPEMIRSADALKAERKASKAEFICGSVLDLTYEPESFDLICGVGLIEYFTPDQITDLIATCVTLLRPNGALVLGSRNRLFNLHSLNSFTDLELELGTSNTLLKEAVEIANAENIDDLTTKALASTVVYPHPDTHPKTTVNVATRYQYTPHQMIRIFSGAQLQTQSLFPVHIHPFPVSTKADYLNRHISISENMYKTATTDHRLIPLASTFIIDGRKSG